jgi:hypothetical protein
MSYAYNVKRGKRAAKARATENDRIVRLYGIDTLHMHAKAREKRIRELDAERGQTI